MKVVKNNILIFLLLILALLFNNKANAYSYKNRDIKIIGHRGASEYEPENTIPAFEKAAKLRDQLGELRQQWSDMHSVGESKLKKPRKNSKKQSPKSKKVHI